MSCGRGSGPALSVVEGVTGYSPMKKKKSSKDSENSPGIRKKMLAKILGTTIIIGGFISLLGVGTYTVMNADFLNVRHFLIYDNKFLSDKEIIHLMNLGEKNIIRMDMKILADRMERSPWIRKALLRKEYPNRLLVKVTEAKPTALLHEGRRIYLVDERGSKLDRLPRTVPFLPLIRIHRGDEKIYKKTYQEAVKISNVIKESTFFDGKRIEINGSKPENISMKINGTVVLVGAGKYEKKLLNFLTLKEEIERRNISAEYIDVRFSKRLIVKPLKSLQPPFAKGGKGN